MIGSTRPDATGPESGPVGAASDFPAPATPNRRRFLGGAALTAAGLAVGGAAGYSVRAATAGAPTVAAGTGETGPDDVVVPFYGSRQAGVVTPQQERLMFAALDVTSTDVHDVQLLLGRWAAIAARFTQGKSVSDAPGLPSAPPADTGEALDLGPHALTITVGFGASLFDQRFGLAGKMPAALQPLGALPGEGDMDPDTTGGDLAIQVCGDDPQVVFHAVRNMIRVARGTAVLRWSQLGFGRASATGAGQTTPRNLMGFKDGTNNIHADAGADLEADVWVGGETDQPWMRNGTYLVARKIAMDIEAWDADSLGNQEQVFGRTKVGGAPLSGGTEFTPVDLIKKDAQGTPVIDVKAHIRLAAPASNGGVRILRRGYNYTDGLDPVTGRLAAGLFFLAFQQNPQTQFKVIQSRLGQFDLLNEYISHVGGGVWACPPGVSGAGDWFGKSLFV